MNAASKSAADTKAPPCEDQCKIGALNSHDKYSCKMNLGVRVGSLMILSLYWTQDRNRPIERFDQ